MMLSVDLNVVTVKPVFLSVCLLVLYFGQILYFLSFVAKVNRMLIN